MIPDPRQSGFIRIYSFRCLTCAFLFLCLVPVINSWTCCQDARCLSEHCEFPSRYESRGVAKHHLSGPIERIQLNRAFLLLRVGRYMHVRSPPVQALGVVVAPASSTS